jgi:SAM-dependent methyltransferase
MEHPLLRRTGLWFWPSICDAKTWAEGDIGNYRDPSGFREYGHDIEVLCETVTQHATAPDAPILDLGCNAGRHLNLLVAKGFTNLHGVDICKRALELMEEWFPETKGKVELHHDLFQRYLPKLPERFFEIVYTHATTIEAAHPSFNMVKAIARVTGKHAILLIQEHDYHTRFWEHEFRRQGFLLTFIRRPVEPNERPEVSGKNFSPTTLFVFTRMGVGLETSA